jgi:D-alanyl-D-alanine carboxypeptidase
MPAMNNDFVGNYLSLQHTYFEPRQLVDLAQTLPATAGWSYSNTNYVVAGLLIQRVAGRPVGEEITRRIINRVKLRDTYWPRQGEQDIRGDTRRATSPPRPVTWSTSASRTCPWHGRPAPWLPRRATSTSSSPPC